MLPSKKKIYSFMRQYYPEFIDNCNEINMTKLAEYAADYFCEVGGYNVFLDEISFDIDEVFYECAYDISEEYNSGQLLILVQ